jgi:hypothetical protein
MRSLEMATTSNVAGGGAANASKKPKKTATTQFIPVHSRREPIQLNTLKDYEEKEMLKA